MHYALLFSMFLMLVCLPETSTFVDCRTSCHKCREGYETADILEVYCSMCKECFDRQLDKTKSQSSGGYGPAIGLLSQGLGVRRERVGVWSGPEKTQGSPGGRPEAPGSGPSRPGGRPGNHPGGRPGNQPGGRFIGIGGRPIRPGGRPLGPGVRPIGPGGRPMGPGGRVSLGRPYGKGGRPGLMGKGPMRPSPGGKPSAKGGILSQLHGRKKPNFSKAVLLQNHHPVARMQHRSTTTHSPKIIHKIKKLKKHPFPVPNKSQPFLQKIIDPPKQEVQLRQQNHAVTSSLGNLETIEPLPPLGALRPLNIGDQTVYLHEAMTARPAECPPPPPDCQEVTETVILLAVTSTTTTTTTTTTMTTMMTEILPPPPPLSCPPFKCKTKECCPTPPPVLIAPQALMLPPPPPLILPPPPPPVMYPPPMLLPPPPPPPPPPPIMAMPFMVQQPYMIPQGVPQSQCNTHTGVCGNNGYEYDNFMVNEISPQTRQTQLQSEFQNEPQPEPAPLPENDPEIQELPQPEDEPHDLTPRYESNTVEPDNNDMYDDYNGVNVTDVLRDKNSGKEYYYVYVGVPKNSVNEFKNKLLRAGVQTKK